MKVGIADLPGQYQSIREELDAAIHGVMESGAFILGETVERLEEEVAAFCGARFGIAVNSGTDALMLSLVAHGIGPGDEVIVPPFTFVATAEAVALVGAVPVFADIDPTTFNLCPKRAEAAVTPRTRAIIPVDLFGQPADRTALGALAQRHGLAVIWDSAQSIGAAFDDQPLGRFPGTVSLSFFPTKNLGACGDGGMVLTNDPGIRDRLRNLRFHGSGGGYVYARVGYCSRLDALQAAILLVKLRHLPAWTESRRRNADRYRALLHDTCVTLPIADPRVYHTYHQFTLRSARRDALIGALREAGIGAGIYYPLALHLQEAYRSLGGKAGDHPHSELATTEVVSIPVHPELTDEQIVYVADAVRRFAHC